MAGCPEIIRNSKQRGLGIQRVEDGLNEENIHAASDQMLNLLPIRGGHLFEGDITLSGIVDVARNRERPIQRSDRAGDKYAALFARVGRFAGDTRRGAIDVGHDFAHAIIGLCDRGAAEGIGFDDVGACRHVLAVDLTNDIRLRQDQQVIVALYIPRPIFEALPAVRLLVQLVALDHRAHRAVEKNDARSQQLVQQLLSGGYHLAKTSVPRARSLCLASSFSMSKIRFQILPPIDRPDEAVFVTGSIPPLGDWQPEKSLRLKWKPPYHLGEIEAGMRFEYKILRCSWQAEAVDAYGDVPANYSCEAWLDSIQHHTVADWKDRYRGRLTREQIHSRVLAGNRELLVWLPQSYGSESQRRFPLIVLHDGANVFDPSTSPISGVDWAADEWVNLLSNMA